VKISQGSVATPLRCDGIFYYRFPRTKSVGEKTLTIGQDLAKLEAKYRPSGVAVPFTGHRRL